MLRILYLLYIKKKKEMKSDSLTIVNRRRNASTFTAILPLSKYHQTAPTPAFPLPTPLPPAKKSKPKKLMKSYTHYAREGLLIFLRQEEKI